MSTQVYQLGGSGSVGIPGPTIISPRDPVATDLVSPNGGGYQIGQLWQNTTSGSIFEFLGSATWSEVSQGAGGPITTLTGTTGTANPSGGNIQIAGTANQITTAGSGSAITLTLPSAITTPGSLTTTTTLTAGTGVTASTGNISATGGSVNAGTTMTAGTGITSTTGNIVATAGAVTAGTTMSATTSMTTASFITSSATLGTTFTDNSITPTGSNSNIDLLVNGKGTGGVIQSRGLVGGDVTVEVTNTDNTNGASRAGFEVAVGGSTAGDPYVNFLVSGAGVYTMGIDNSVSDNFVIAASAALGTSNIVSWTSAGALTNSSSITSTTGNITATSGNFVASAAGTGLVLPVGTASGATPQVVDARVGSVTFTGISIAAAADSTLVLTNSTITGASTRVLLSMIGATTGSATSIKSVTPSAGSLSIVVTNGTGATTTTADITFDFIVLN